MNLRYEADAIRHQRGKAVRVKTPCATYGEAVAVTIALLKTAYGPGYVIEDAGRFTHWNSPNARAAFPSQFPPRVGPGREARGPADASISVYFVPDARSLPPFATLKQVRARPSAILYRPRLGADELAYRLLLAAKRHPRRVLAVYALLLLWVYLDGLHG